MIKVLHVIGNLSMGGAEFQCRQLINRLQDPEFGVGIAFFREGPNPDVSAHVKRFPVERGRWLDVAKVVRQVDRIIDGFEPDLVHVWIPEIITVPAAISAWRRKIPIVAGLRNTLAFENDWNKFGRDRLRSIQYLLATRIISNFAVTEEPAPFRWLYRHKRGICIPNGMSIDALRSIPKKALPVRSDYRLIFAGRLAYQKGIPLALEALKLLVDKGLDVHLTLFGEGPSKVELGAKVESLGLTERVTFFGQCRDWQAYADDAACLVFPTRGEGTSNVVLESLAVGLPVVMAEIAMSRSLLTNGKNALVIRTRDPAEWAQRIAELLENPDLVSTLRSEGRALADRFSVKVMVEQHERIYREMVGAVQG